MGAVLQLMMTARVVGWWSRRVASREMWRWDWEGWTNGRKNLDGEPAGDGRCGCHRAGRTGTCPARAGCLPGLWAPALGPLRPGPSSSLLLQMGPTDQSTRIFS